MSGKKKGAWELGKNMWDEDRWCYYPNGNTSLTEQGRVEASYGSKYRAEVQLLTGFAGYQMLGDNFNSLDEAKQAVEEWAESLSLKHLEGTQ